MDFFRKRRLYKIFLAWKIENKMAMRTMQRIKKVALVAWYAEVKKVRLFHLMNIIASVSFNDCRIRLCFEKW